MFFAPYHHRIAYFYHTGLFERSALSVWKDQAKEANVIYDIGGFSGIYGLLAAKVNPNARILIFEPDVINAEHIRKNIKANGLSNCEVDEAAVSDVPGTARFSQGGSSGERLSEWGREVRVETLDDLPPANLIKIDVEGAEAKVIAGGKHALQKKPKIMLEIHPWGLSEADQEQMWSTLRGLGYQWKQVADDTEGSPHYLVS